MVCNKIKLIFSIFIGSCIFLLPCFYVQAGAAENEIENYAQKRFTSANGVEGTAVNTITTTKDGYIWIGGYGGLQRYNGEHFEKILFSDVACGVNELMEDREGNLWICTTSDGVYRYSDDNFSKVSLLNDKEEVGTAQCITEGQKGEVYVGTNKGLFHIRNNKKTERFLENKNIRDLAYGDSGILLVVTKEGDVFSLKDGAIKKQNISEKFENGIARCLYYGKANRKFYIGSNTDEIMILKADGTYLDQIVTKKLETMNDLMELSKTELLICSDSGLGVMRGSEVIYIQTVINNSIEKVCQDFQGNYWFASSKEGVMEMLPTNFIDLSKRFSVQGYTVNTVLKSGNQMYIGTDDALLYYENDVPVENELTKLCNGFRIRQILKDSGGTIWVATFGNGIYQMKQNGEILHITPQGSGIQTDQIRCMSELQDGNILVGTEHGICFIEKSGEVMPYYHDSELCEHRIMSIVQRKNGEIMVGTDGSGLFCLGKSGKREKNISISDGLTSDYILRMTYDEKRDGIWIVTGNGISYLNKEKEIKNINSFPYPSNRDIILDEDDTMYVISGNGLYVTTGEDMLLNKKLKYKHYNYENGCTVDFTPNAWNYVEEEYMYLCTTTGLIKIRKNNLDEQDTTLRLGIDEIIVDNKKMEFNNEKIVIPYNAERISFDVVPLNYGYQDGWVTFQLVGEDKTVTKVKASELIPVVYTHLKGGNYEFQISVAGTEDGEVMDSAEIWICKEYDFWEKPSVKILLALAILIIFSIALIYYIEERDKIIQYKYERKLKAEKQAYIESLAYQDIVTEVGNRNFFEKEQKTFEHYLKMGGEMAVFSVGVDSLLYITKQYGREEAERVLRNISRTLKNICKKNAYIYRLSGNTFLVCEKHPDNIENTIQRIKKIHEVFAGEDGKKYVISVGVAESKEGRSFKEMVSKAEELRMLNKKINEKKLISGDTSWLV